MNFLGKAFDEISEGETFGQSLTIDASHISRACGMFGDFNPLHSDAEFCANSRFGRPILHGPMTSAFMSASIGMYFYGTAVPYLEHNCRFVAPVFAGDTLSVQWTITQTLDKPRSNGGIAVLRGECSNQRGEQIAEASGKILLSNRALVDVVQAGG
ncbi:acyl dehydratase [Pseudomonas fragi]|uniref:MaoC family dehydratase n=1 Tax=Pseudomonas fragi TaxID=296 RepID=UPI00193BC0E9|nr:MaoC/PaaZ C-terminal domain-containing protein [Pseudomonas fragi]MBM1198216.1 acyl dehydratase [Pseudomonas fragi]